jgi:hypothetical protein
MSINPFEWAKDFLILISNSLSKKQKVKVILRDEDEDWNELALREFEKGYDVKDSIYNSI